MIVAPIYTRNLNGMLVGSYSQQAIARMTAPEPVAPRAIQTYMSFDITPERGDMAEIRRYFAAQETAQRWGNRTVGTPKRKTTDELVREFLIESIDKANERRALKDAETDMPYYGVLAGEETRRQMAANALGGDDNKGPAVPQEDFRNVNRRGGVKNKSAFSQETLSEKRATSAIAVGKQSKDAKIAARREALLRPPSPISGGKRGAEAPRGGSPPAAKRRRRGEE